MSAESEKRQKDLKQLSDYFIEKLEANYYQPSQREDFSISFSMTHLGLDQVYAEIGLEELEYHLDNNEWDAWTGFLLDNDNNNVDDVVETEVNAWTKAEAIQLAIGVFTENKDMKPEYHVRVERNK